jgi:hypothetical protein
MKNILKSILAFCILIQCSCNQSSTTEKENELLKKENELLKIEQELNSKGKNNQSDDINNESLNSNTNPTTSTNNSWITFNHRYGFSIELPNYFKEGALTASAIQYYVNDLNDDIIISVETTGEGSMSSLANDYQNTINSESGVDYKVLKNNWYVVSGQNQQDIYYFRTFFKNGQTHYLRIEYPVSKKDIFDSLLPRISKSFK